MGWLQPLHNSISCSSKRALGKRCFTAVIAWMLWRLQFPLFPASLASDLSKSVGQLSAHLSNPTLIGVPIMSPESGQPLMPSAFPPSYAPDSSTSPLYPFFPDDKLPMLSGKCSLNFTNVLKILGRTAADCVAPFASYLGNVICCPQFRSMLRVFQGEYSKGTGFLALNSTEAKYCFSDILSILVSEGSNETLPILCSARSANLTGGTCPVKSIADFESAVNVSKLLAHCKGVDPLKECCDPFCQPAISEAARILAAKAPGFAKSDDGIMTLAQQQMVNNCEDIVLAWLSAHLGSEIANTVLRNLFSCTVNEECPLVFNNPAEVVKNCNEISPSNRTCCDSLSKYISAMQQQTLITNLQALDCVNSLGSTLQRSGVTTDIYTLCHVYLKDFTLQTFGSQGCLLRSLPTDVSKDKSSGITFTCDLNDNIAAPWPPTSPSTPFSFCTPEVSMPALPGTESSGCCGYQRLPKILVIYLTIFTSAMLYF